MKVELGKKALKYTYQEVFPEKTSCCRCEKIARIGFVIQEQPNQPEYVCNLHQNNGAGGYWLHDACAVAIYFCKECLEPTALYNQA